MSSLFEELRKGLSDPSTRHAALVHLPIAMSLLGVVVALLAATTRRSRTLRAVAIIWFLALALSAFMATRSGEQAEGALPAGLPEVAYQRLDQHIDMGERVWIFAIAAAALFAISLASSVTVRATASALALGAALAGAGWTALVGHHGGVLVYEHGLGTAPLREALAAREAGAALEREAAALLEASEAAASEIRAASSDETAAQMASAADHQAQIRDPRAVFFREAVLPILAANCQSCHNAVRPKARLDLTSAQGLLAGGRSGTPAVLPGRAEESLLIALLRGSHPEIDQMPPEDPLPSEEIDILVRWVNEGAVWEDDS
jgi:uncharacterized membrane protein